MDIIPEHAMNGSNSVFYHWESYKIPEYRMKLPEAIDVVDRFSRKGSLIGPMRSTAAQRAADIIHDLLQYDPDPRDGLLEDYDRTLRHYWNYRKIPIPTIAVLIDASHAQFDRAVQAHA